MCLFTCKIRKSQRCRLLYVCLYVSSVRCKNTWTECTTLSKHWILTNSWIFYARLVRALLSTVLLSKHCHCSRNNKVNKKISQTFHTLIKLFQPFCDIFCSSKWFNVYSPFFFFFFFYESDSLSCTAQCRNGVVWKDIFAIGLLPS